ncbi:MAG: Sigma-70 region 2 [Bacteroidota bacterium]|jgi:RNA polymerase sigma factor (sigma-70 family)
MHPLSEKEYKELFAATIRYVVQNSGSREDAENLLSETLCKFYAGQLTYTEKGSFGGFLMKVIKNRWIDELRKRKTKKSFWKKFFQNEEVSYKPDLESDIDYNNYLCKSDLSNDSEAAMAALFKKPDLLKKHTIYVQWEDTACRKRLELAYIDGLPNKTIAKMEGVKENTFNQRLTRCCQSFIELYNRSLGKK